MTMTLFAQERASLSESDLTQDEESSAPRAATSKPGLFSHADGIASNNKLLCSVDLPETRCGCCAFGVWCFYDIGLSTNIAAYGAPSPVIQKVDDRWHHSHAAPICTSPPRSAPTARFACLLASAVETASARERGHDSWRCEWKNLGAARLTTPARHETPGGAPEVVIGHGKKTAAARDVATPTAAADPGGLRGVWFACLLAFAGAWLWFLDVVQFVLDKWSRSRPGELLRRPSGQLKAACRSSPGTRSRSPSPQVPRVLFYLWVSSATFLFFSFSSVRPQSVFHSLSLDVCLRDHHQQPSTPSQPRCARPFSTQARIRLARRSLIGDIYLHTLFPLVFPVCCKPATNKGETSNKEPTKQQRTSNSRSAISTNQQTFETSFWSSHYSVHRFPGIHRTLRLFQRSRIHRVQ